MPTIYIKNYDRTIEGNMLRSIFINLQMNQVGIDTICGGRGMCVRCAIRILQGEEGLNQISPHEEIRLKAIEAEDGIRLACQTHARRDVEIEIINLPVKR